MTTKKQFEKAIKQVLLSKPANPVRFKNKTPSKQQLNQKFKLDRK